MVVRGRSRIAKLDNATVRMQSKYLTICLCSGTGKRSVGQRWVQRIGIEELPAQRPDIRCVEHYTARELLLNTQ